MFSDVLSTGQVTSVNVDTNQTDKLLRLLDTVVIKLEGGTDEDLKVLDEKPNIEQRPEPVKEPLSASTGIATAVVAAAAVTAVKANNTAAADSAKSEDGAINENDDDSNDVKEVEVTPVEANADDQKAINADEKPNKKRKRTTSGSSSSSSSSTSSSGN